MWEFKTGDHTSPSHAIPGDYGCVGSRDNYIYCLFG